MAANMADLDNQYNKEVNDYEEYRLKRDEDFKRELQRNQFEHDKKLLEEKLEALNRFTDALNAYANAFIQTDKQTIVINIPDSIKPDPVFMAQFVKELMDK